MTHISKRTIFLTGFVLLHIVAIVWTMVIGPFLTRLPEDFELSFDVISTDNFFEESEGDFSGALHSKTFFTYETVEHDANTSLIKNVFDVRTPDNDPIFSVERVYGIDRYSYAHIPEKGDAMRNGYLFAPRQLGKGDSFTYWHINYDGPARMRYVGTEQLAGIETFLYETRYENVRIDQTENLGYLPGVGVTRGVELEPYLQLWVEPHTGRIIKYKDTTTAYYYNLKTGERIHPWNHFSNVVSDESVARNAVLARTERTMLRTVEMYVPIVLYLLSFFLLFRAFGKCTSVRACFRSDRVIRVTALILSLTALFNTAGWVFRNNTLISLVPGGSAMNPLTAFCFSLLGLVFVLKVRNKHKTIIGVSAVILLITLLRFAGNFGIITWDVDLFLFRDRVIDFPSSARMSVATTVSFFLVALIPIADSFSSLKRTKLAEILSFIIGIFAFYALIGYIFDLSQILETSTFVSTSLHTAILFFVASIGLNVSYRDDDVETMKMRGKLFLSFILGLCTFLTVTLAHLVDGNFTRTAHVQFQLEVDRVMNAFDERFNIYINALEGGIGLFASSQSVERDEWKAYVDAIEIQRNYPGIQGMGYSIFVEQEDLEAHIQSIRNEGFPEYTVRPSGVRDVYSAIIYLEPFDKRNRQAFGFDMYQEAVRRLAMQQARDSGEPRISGRITLVQEIDSDVQPGFLIYVPFYKNGEVHETLQERQESIVGYVYSAFRARDFVEGVIGSDGITNIGLHINDGIEGTEDALYYDDTDRVIDEELRSRFTETRTLYVAGRPWSFHFRSTETYGFTTFNRFFPFAVLIVGIGISILIALLFYTLITARESAIAYANKVTTDLRESKAKDEALLQSIGDGLVAVDEHGQVIFMNAAAESMLGWTASEMKGVNFAERVSLQDGEQKSVAPNARPINNAVEKRMSTKLGVSDHIYYVNKDGNSFPVTITVTPVVIGDTCIGAIEVFRDVTKEESLSRRQSEFMSVASHQLRTPVTALRLAIEVLLKERMGNLTQDQKGVLEPAMGYANNLVETIHTMLLSSRADAGTVDLSWSDIPLKEFIEEILEEHAFWSKKKKQNIKLFVSNDLDIRTDKALLREILSNLISNAIRYSLESAEIDVHAAKVKNSIVLSVKDSGMGIPKSAQQHIFNKFFRADNARKTVTDGTGLGLYLVHTLVTMLKGTIEFTSEEGVGTTFTVTLPSTPILDGK